MIKLIECPRDAMQGWKTLIATKDKIEYLNLLLKVGFDTLDCGSFVSAKAIPQMADTAQVLDELDWQNSSTKLLTIIANERGATDAAKFEQISFLGFPFSVSETFQQRNTNSSISESLKRVEAIQQIVVDSKKELVVYLSMAFGNPYNDPYNEQIVYEWAKEISDRGIKIISLADTVGVASPEQVKNVSKVVAEMLPDCEIGVHLHAQPMQWESKLDAALEAGISRIDGALKGIGGCPMADDHLVGNMNTELMIPYLQQKNLLANIYEKALEKASLKAAQIFI